MFTDQQQFCNFVEAVLQKTIHNFSSLKRVGFSFRVLFFEVKFTKSSSISNDYGNSLTRSFFSTKCGVKIWCADCAVKQTVTRL